jgi:hypothetical protein
MNTNRHPVDELADLRATRKRLDDREAELRTILLAAGADLYGSDHTARIVTAEQRRLSRKLLKERFGPNAITQCSEAVTIVYIHLENRTTGEAQSQPQVGVTNVTERHG